MRTPKKQHIANGITTTILVHIFTSMISYSNSIGSVVGTGVGKSVRSVVMIVFKVIHSVVAKSHLCQLMDLDRSKFDCSFEKKQNVRPIGQFFQDTLDLQYEWIESNGLDFKP